MPLPFQVSSPSRTYVAMCCKPNFNGFYFKKFVLPESFEQNQVGSAIGYFLEQDEFAHVDKILTIEDYQSITELEVLEVNDDLIDKLKEVYDEP